MELARNWSLFRTSCCHVCFANVYRVILTMLESRETAELLDSKIIAGFKIWRIWILSFSEFGEFQIWGISILSIFKFSEFQICQFLNSGNICKCSILHIIPWGIAKLRAVICGCCIYCIMQSSTICKQFCPQKASATHWMCVLWQYCMWGWGTVVGQSLDNGRPAHVWRGKFWK